MSRPDFYPGETVEITGTACAEQGQQGLVVVQRGEVITVDLGDYTKPFLTSELRLTSHNKKGESL